MRLVRPFLRALSLAALIAAGGAGPALAQSAPDQPTADGKFPPASVLVVDYDRLLNEATAAGDIRTQIQGLKAKMQKDVDADEAGLKKEEAALRAKQATLSGDEFAKARDAFQKKVADVQRRVQSRNRQLEGALGSATDKLRQAIVPIFSDIMNGQKATVLLDTSSVLYADASLDITKQTLDRLNQAITKVKVELPPAN
jgi:Skp family chaperone for outer membrane proteins